MKDRNLAIKKICNATMCLDRLQVELCGETPYDTPTPEQTRKRILAAMDKLEEVYNILCENKED